MKKKKGYDVNKKSMAYELCIKCGEPVHDKGMIFTEDNNGDGFYVSACDNSKCSRYGLITTVTK